MHRLRRWVIPVMAVVAIAAVAALMLRRAPAAVEVARVTRGAMQVTVADEGVTRLHRRFVVSAPVAGRVRRIDATPGDRVSRGATLAVISPAPPSPLDARSRAAAEARVDTATAAVERARADRARLVVEAEQAVRDHRRLEVLLAGGGVAAETVETAQSRVRSASEAVRAAEAAVRAAEFAETEARAALLAGGAQPSGRDVTVPAPIDGLVLRRLQESEAVIGPGTPLLEIGNLADLEVVADLLSSDAVGVSPGAEVRITAWGGGRDLQGRVRRVEPAGFTKISALGVEEQRVNVVIDFDAPPESRTGLGDGYRVEVRIVLSSRADVLLVPTPSLFRVNGRWSVLAVVDGRLERRDVTIGAQNDQVTEATAGLAEGDRVVLYPGESLSDGARVDAREVVASP